jgi:hypothetical protein
MAAEIPDIEPSSFIAGDTVKWTKSLSDYPATTWTLTYELRGVVRKTIVCTANGRDFLATISATDSAAYQAGDYFWFARVSSGGEVYSVGSGTLTVLENPSVGTSAQDRRSHARKMLDAIEAMLENNASREEMQYEISVPGGSIRRLWLCSKDELIRFHSHYAQLVRAEENAERIARGQKPRNRILTVFTRS